MSVRRCVRCSFLPRSYRLRGDTEQNLQGQVLKRAQNLTVGRAGPALLPTISERRMKCHSPGIFSGVTRHVGAERHSQRIGGGEGGEKMTSQGAGRARCEAALSLVGMG